MLFNKIPLNTCFFSSQDIHKKKPPTPALVKGGRLYNTISLKAVELLPS